jgi:predicted house-cleaning noncanonical NTP pyrophosphatase (MazG superfamily)
MEMCSHGGCRSTCEICLDRRLNNSGFVKRNRPDPDREMPAQPIPGASNTEDGKLESLDAVLSECHRILKNPTGLYHGWFTLTVTKYGTFVARAVKNPSEFSDDDLGRSPTRHHYGSSMLEASLALLGELREWELAGRPFDTWKDIDNSSRSLEDLFLEVGQWAVSTFTQATPESWCKHLQKEVAELAEDPSDLEEIADCMILLAGLAHKQNYTPQDLRQAIREKLEINKKRVWGKPDKDGVVEHVRDEPALYTALTSKDKENG